MFRIRNLTVPTGRAVFVPDQELISISFAPLKSRFEMSPNHPLILSRIYGLLIASIVLLTASESARAAQFQQGDKVKLTRSESLSFRDEVFRTGEEGELFTVLAYRPEQKKVFVLSKDKAGKDIALSIPVDAVVAIEPPSQIDISAVEKRYSSAMENLLVAQVITRLAKEAGDKTLADRDATFEAVKRNRIDLFNSPLMRRAIALAAATSQLAPEQAKRISIKGLPNLFDCVLRRNLPLAMESGDTDSFAALLDQIESGLAPNALISADVISERAMQLSDRDIERSFRMPMFKRAGEFNGRSLRRWIAETIANSQTIKKETLATIGGTGGLQSFMAQFVTPSEATEASTILAKLAQSFPSLPQRDRETLASQLATKTEMLLGNREELVGFGYQSTFDAEVAFAASSKTVINEVQVARERLLKNLELADAVSGSKQE